MTDQPSEIDVLLHRATAGDQSALAEAFEYFRSRLKRMVQLRLDRRLHGRIDPSDVLQEAYLDLAKRAADYLAHPELPFFLWLRLLTGQRLLAIHRQHLGAKMRAVGREVSLQHDGVPRAASASLAAQLLGRLSTPSKAAMRAEMQRLLQEALDSMDAIDREVLVLRHFEELSNDETAAVLGLQKAAASNRYVRALKRLRGILRTMPGFSES